jgi:RHS repeat-associated protein
VTAHRPALGWLSATRRRRRGALGAATSAALVAALSLVPANGAAAATAAVSYTYDAAGRLATVTQTGGQTATYHYDAAGNVTSVTYGSSGSIWMPAAPARAPRPTISGVEPAKTKPGGAIVIFGRGFSTLSGADTVRVGALFAPVRQASIGRLVVTAPPGAGGPVTVTTRGGQAVGGKVMIEEPHVNRPPAPGINRHPLLAPAGVTAVSGLVERPDGNPIAGVRVMVTAARGGTTQARAVTDRSGRFLIGPLPAGDHQLVIDGNIAGGTSYGLYAEPVQLVRGRTTVMPWLTYLTPLDMAHAVNLPSPTTRQVTVTDPHLPGLLIEIPPGTVIHDYYGKVVHQVSLTALATGRTPFPWAPNMVPQYFSLQPGDASVSGPGIRIVYPNASNQPPGTTVPYLVASPDWPGTGWWAYGSGRVSADGRQVIPSAGTAYRRILPGGYGTGDSGCILIFFCPAPGHPDQGGEPVDLGTGLFQFSQTDLSLPDVMGATLSRTYRQAASDIFDFGMGMSDSLNLYIDADGGGNFDMFLPDGSFVKYTPTSTTGVYDAVGSPTIYVGSTLTMGSGDPDGPFTVVLKDGTTMAFSNPAFLTKVTDRYGNSLSINRIEYTYPSSGGGRINSVTTSDGRWMQFTYGVCVPGSNPSYCVTSIEDNSGRTVTYSYDTDGRLTSVVGADGGVTTYNWAPCTTTMTCTELDSITDANGNTTISNTYDANGRVVTQTQADGGKWTYTYQLDSNNQVTQTDWSNPLGVNYSMTFNANGYPAAQTDGVGSQSTATTSSVFDPTTNLLTSQTDALGRQTTYSYDSQGNLATLTLLAGTAQAATYGFTYESTYNRLTSITDPLKHTTHIAYDDAARTETATDALGHVTRVGLNDEGQAVRVTDPLGHTTYLSYLYGDLVAQADPLGHVTSTYYDDIGRPLDVTDPEGNMTSYTWTPLDEEASQTDPLGDVTSYTYDHDGNLKSVTDPDGHQSAFTYDAMGDLAQQTDALGNVTTYAYDQIGDLISRTDGNNSLTIYSYDNLDRLAKVSYGVSGTTSQSSIAYSYDAANRLVKAVDSTSGTYGFTYSGLNGVLNAITPQGNVTYTYNVAGQRKTMTVPNQATVGYTYNPDNQLVAITQGATTVKVGYNADSLPASMTLPDGVTQKTTYNADLEATSIAYSDSGAQVGNLAYTYNPDSFLSSVGGSLADASLPPQIATAVYNADDQLTSEGSTAYTYDHDGNLRSDGTNTYTWNARGELSAISGATTATYGYDPFGRQATSSVGGGATSYLYDGGQMVEELSGTSATASFLADTSGDVLQMTTGTGSQSVLADATGSTTALANASGQLATTYTYNPAGQATTSGGASTNPFQFAGAQVQAAGLYSMGARTYDPATGTFTSPDPMGADAGKANPYTYAGDNAVNFTERTGLRASRPHGPTRIARGKGAQPTPAPAYCYCLSEVAGGSAAPAPAPQGGAGGGSGGRPSGTGGDGSGEGQCVSASVNIFIGGQVSTCTYTLSNGQTFTSTSFGPIIGIPGASVTGSQNVLWGVNSPSQLGGFSQQCDASVGDGFVATGSLSNTSFGQAAIGPGSSGQASVGGGLGVGPLPVGLDCGANYTVVSS